MSSWLAIDRAGHLGYFDTEHDDEKPSVLVGDPEAGFSWHLISSAGSTPTPSRSLERTWMSGRGPCSCSPTSIGCEAMPSTSTNSATV
jgi:hypothetical protein